MHIAKSAIIRTYEDRCTGEAEWPCFQLTVQQQKFVDDAMRQFQYPTCPTTRVSLVPARADERARKALLRAALMAGFHLRYCSRRCSAPQVMLDIVLRPVQYIQASPHIGAGVLSSGFAFAEGERNCVARIRFVHHPLALTFFNAADTHQMAGQLATEGRLGGEVRMHVEQLAQSGLRMAPWGNPLHLCPFASRLLLHRRHPTILVLQGHASTNSLLQAAGTYYAERPQVAFTDEENVFMANQVDAMRCPQCPVTSASLAPEYKTAAARAEFVRQELLYKLSRLGFALESCTSLGIANQVSCEATRDLALAPFQARFHSFQTGFLHVISPLNLCRNSIRFLVAHPEPVPIVLMYNGECPGPPGAVLFVHRQALTRRDVCNTNCAELSPLSTVAKQRINRQIGMLNHPACLAALASLLPSLRDSDLNVREHLMRRVFARFTVFACSIYKVDPRTKHGH